MRARPRRPALGFSVELGDDQDDDHRNPHPHHEADDGPERAVGLVEAAEIRRVPGKERGGGEPAESGERASPADPAPARFGPARSEPEETGEPQRDQYQE